MGVAGLDEREVGDVGRSLDLRVALDQPGAGHRRDRLPEEAHGTGRHVLARAIAQGDIDVRDVHVERGIAGIDADVDLGVVALEGLQPRNQPHRGEGREGGERHALAPGVLADLAHRAVDARQRLLDGQQQLRTGARQFDCPRVAQEQGHAHFFFERLDLPAHGGLGQCHFLGGGAKVEVARDRLERAQMAGGDRPGTEVGLGMEHGGGFGPADGLMRNRNQ